MAERKFVAVATTRDLPPGSAKPIELDGRSLLLCHSGGRIHAIENQCSHALQPLECGLVKNGWIACPTHGARFDLETGEAISGPATEPIATFAVRIEGDTIEVAL
jgi:3-phenylpropionate/trans-cinnamate dioxygenase ferredoxin component